MFGGDAATFYGEGGNDELKAPSASSYANGGSGTDTCDAGYMVSCEVVITPIPSPTVTVTPPSVPAQCSSMTFDNTIVGTDGSDTINGTEGRDLIFGLDGSDTINGLGGDDCIVVGDGADSLYGNNGNDVLLGTTSADLHGGSGNDKLYAPSTASYADGGANTDTCESGYNVNCEVVITPTPTP
jgi:Ca2+-binding RTX toxin-like protein